MKRIINMPGQNKGFTLVELIVSMAVFIIILIIAGEAFNTIVTQASKFSKSEETNIEGIIGLEVMRHDLEQMGFGLPWGFCQPLSGTTDGSCVSSSIQYAEATDVLGKTLNDGPTTGSLGAGSVPRAFVAADAFGNFSSDYIGVKATSVGRNMASQRWTYIPFHNFSTAGGRESRPVTFPSNNLQENDKVTVIRSNYNDPDDDHLLIVDPLDSGKFDVDYIASSWSLVPTFLPKSDLQMHMVYGVDTDSALRMPFNRADFFIKIPSTEGSLPSFCAPRTGVLYKKTVNQANGAYLSMPLLDCVADMQVVLGWDTSEGGQANSVNAYSSLPSSSVGAVSAVPAGVSDNIKNWLTDAKALREHLKMVKVYILAQEGKRDKNYSSPPTFIVGKDCRAAESGDIDCGSNLTRTYTLTADQQQYRWKLYRIIVRPRNLVSNQR